MRNKFLGTGEPGYHPIRKVRTVISGLRYAVIYDFSVAYKLVVSVVLLAAAFALRAWLDFMLILVATGIVLVAETLNSAIEALCDIVEPRRDERVKVVKDVAAAAVGLAIVVWVIVVAAEAWNLVARLSAE